MSSSMIWVSIWWLMALMYHCLYGQGKHVAVPQVTPRPLHMIATQPIPRGAQVVNMSWLNAFTCSVACTGKANVRLYHDSRRGVLQMIATQPIPRRAQVVNTYGDLPNSELLRRFGLVETEPNPHDCSPAPSPRPGTCRCSRVCMR
jgi:hypothetical protein